MDRDPPNGRSVYKVKVRVKDGGRKEKEKGRRKDNESTRERRSTRNGVKLRLKRGRLAAANSVTSGAVTENVNKRNSRWKDSVGVSRRETELISGEERTSQKHRTNNYYSGALGVSKTRSYCKSFRANKNKKAEFVPKKLLRFLKREANRPSRFSKDLNDRANQTDVIFREFWLTSKTKFMSRRGAESDADLLKSNTPLYSIRKRKTKKETKNKKGRKPSENKRMINKNNKKRVKSKFSKSFEKLNFEFVKNIKDLKGQIKKIEWKGIQRELKNLQTFFRVEWELGRKNKEKIELKTQNIFSNAKESFIEYLKFLLKLKKNCYKLNFKNQAKFRKKTKIFCSPISFKPKSKAVFNHKEKSNKTSKVKGQSGLFRCYHIRVMKDRHHLQKNKRCVKLNKTYFEALNVWFCLKKNMLKYCKKSYECHACTKNTSFESFLIENLFSPILNLSNFLHRPQFFKNKRKIIYLKRSKKICLYKTKEILKVLFSNTNHFRIEKKFNPSCLNLDVFDLKCNFSLHPLSQEIHSKFLQEFLQENANLDPNVSGRVPVTSNSIKHQRIPLYSNLINRSLLSPILKPKTAKKFVPKLNQEHHIDFDCKFYPQKEKFLFQKFFGMRPDKRRVSYQSKYISRKARDAHDIEGKTSQTVKEKGFCVSLDPQIQIDQREDFQGRNGDVENKTLTSFLSRIISKTNKRFDAETILTILVKDINDNAPVFPNTTMYGSVQENGPIGRNFLFSSPLGQENKSRLISKQKNLFNIKYLYIIYYYYYF